MRRLAIAIIFVVLALSMLVAAYLSVPTSSAEPLAMAVEFNVHSAAAWVALDRGLFAKHGINVKTFETFSTGLELSAALARGDINVAWACLGPLLISHARGVPIVIVAQAHLHGYAIVGRPGVTDISQINGGVVTHPGVGSPSHLLLKMVIEKFNLNVTEVQQKTSVAVQALISGQIDAAALPEHQATIAITKGCTPLVRSQELWPQMPGSFLAVKKELLERDPETVKKLISATVEATNFIRENPEESAHIVASHLGISFEEALSSMRMLNYVNSVDLGQVDEYVNLMVKYDILEEQVDAVQAFNLELLNDVMRGRQ